MRPEPSAIIPFPGKPVRKKHKPGYPGSTFATSQVCLLARKCVAEVFNMNALDLLDPARGGRKAAFARQLAIHLAHIVAGRRHDAVGREIWRNRSTASHHFEQVENLRDEPEFDEFLTLLEVRFAHYLNWMEAQPKGAWVPTLDALARAVATGRLEADAHFEAKFVVETFRPPEPRRRATK